MFDKEALYNIAFSILPGNWLYRIPCNLIHSLFEYAGSTENQTLLDKPQISLRHVVLVEGNSLFVYEIFVTAAPRMFLQITRNLANFHLLDIITFVKATRVFMLMSV